jgi:BON domain
MNHRYGPRDWWSWEEQRERETREFERDPDARFGREAGDPRWGTGGMRGDERARRTVRDENERPWPEGPERDAGERVPVPGAHGEWGSAPPPFAHGSTRGPFVGRGPRGYRRSDERIREDVCERFTQHGALDPTDVEISVRGGEVMLTGTVATRAQKRLAEDIVETIFGVAEVHNHLRVQRPWVEPTPSHGTALSEVRRPHDDGGENR